MMSVCVCVCTRVGKQSSVFVCVCVRAYDVYGCGRLVRSILMAFACVKVFGARMQTRLSRSKTCTTVCAQSVSVSECT